MVHKKLFLLGLLLCGSYSVSLAQITKQVHSDFDNIYFSDTDTLHLYEEDFNGLSMLDSVVPNFKVFLTGENHTYTESNARLWLKMIK